MQVHDETFSTNNALESDIIVLYSFQTAMEVHQASIKLCKEQSLSNALGNNPELIKKYSAKYIPSSIKEIDKSTYCVSVTYPKDNCEESLSMILSAAGGDVFNIKDLYPIKILDIQIPDVVFTQKYTGPQFGVKGLRKEFNITKRPLLIGPVKPCVGMNSTDFAARAFQALKGGTDIVKDDELICNPPYNTLEERVKSVVTATREAEQVTGEKKMYFSFIGGGSPKEIMESAAKAKALGVDGYMIAPTINGIEIIRDLKEFNLPIIAHNALWYAMHTKYHGISFSVFAQFQRFCGADIVISPAPYGTFEVMTQEEHIKSTEKLLQKSDLVESTFPAFCGGQSPKTIPYLRKDVGSNDFIVVAGTSLYDHPEGPAEGSKQLKKVLNSV